MLSITNYTDAYTAQAGLSSPPKVPVIPAVPKAAADKTDVYERSDGTSATRNTLGEPAVQRGSNLPRETTGQTDENEVRFRELLHQFIGQTLFGQMLKSMRATQEKNPYFDGGRAEEIFQGQLDMVLTDKMTKATSQTLSEPMYKLMKANMR